MPHHHSHGHDHGAAGHRHTESGADPAPPGAHGGCGHAAHGHGHDHAHGGHGHHHHHGDPERHGRAFLVAIVLNTVFVAVEFGYGFIANSTALMADAGHNLSDVLGLVLAWTAVLLARKPPDRRFTYGLGGSTILAALGNAVLLLVACGAIGLEAVQRLLQPPVVAGAMVTWVAAAGIAVNGVSAWLFAKGSKGDLNIRGAYLHMVADAAVSLGVVVAGLAMSSTGWYLLDPVASLLIVAVILWGTWGLLRESLQLALGAVPPHVDTAAVDRYLRQVPGVADVQHLHVWALSTTESALTVHLVMPQGHPGDAALEGIARALGQNFSVRHSTLQVALSTAPANACGLAP